MNDDHDRLDLSLLDPERDAARLARSRAAILTRVAPSLRARRERGPALWLQLASWRAPVFAAAALLAVASIAVILRTPATRTDAVAVVTPVSTASTPSSLGEAAGLPAGIATWVETGTPPGSSNGFEVQEASQ